MVDIHCHIQPEVDDGPKSWETTLEMCNLADSVANKPALVEHNPHAIVAGQNLPYFPFLSIIVSLRQRLAWPERPAYFGAAPKRNRHVVQQRACFERSLSTGCLAARVTAVRADATAATGR